MSFEIEKIAKAIGGDGNGFEMERIAENVGSGSGGGGSSGGTLFVHITEDPNDQDTLLMDKTWQEIYDAMAEGFPVFGVHEITGPLASGFEFMQFVSVLQGNDAHAVGVYTIGMDGSIDSYMFEAESADDYPVFTMKSQQ